MLFFNFSFKYLLNGILHLLNRICNKTNFYNLLSSTFIYERCFSKNDQRTTIFPFFKHTLQNLLEHIVFHGPLWTRKSNGYCPREGRGLTNKGKRTLRIICPEVFSLLIWTEWVKDTENKILQYFFTVDKCNEDTMLNLKYLKIPCI